MLLFLVLVIGTSFNTVFAQSVKVKGRVTNEAGEGVPGASIKVKGTTAGTMTDVDGNYDLDVPEGSKVLVISSLSDGNKEVTITDANAPLLVTLTKADINANDLAGVTVYGQTQTARQRVSSIVTVSEEQIAARPVTNVINALEGNAPGVNLTSGSGQPGSSPDILVRGFGSLSASSSPLIVLDGSVFDGSLVSINPNDVATMNVLKDASATSIYGARGANGVIMITTKKGKKSDKPTINVDASVGVFNRMIPEYDRVSSQDYYELWWESVYNWAQPQFGELPADIASAKKYTNENLISGFLGGYNNTNVKNNQVVIDGKFNPNASVLYADDWQKGVSRNGLRQKYNVSVSNGDDKSNYYFSVGYNDEKGIVKQSDYKRITTNLNVNSNITPWLKTGFKLGITYDDQKAFAFDGTSAYANIWMTTRMMGPIYPIYLHDTSGNVIYDTDGTTPLYDFGDNPQYGQDRPYAKNTHALAALYNDINTTKAYSGFGTAFLEANFLKDFKIRTNISVNTYNGTNSFYQNKYFGDGEPFGGTINNSITNRISYTFNQLLTWKPSFGIFAADREINSLEITVGHENYLLRNQSDYLQRAGFGPQNLTAGDVAAYSSGSGNSTDYHAIESYLSQANYSYKGKYLLNASFRRDGTSRFAPDVRWGNFWAVGAGWMLSEETFMKDNKTFSFVNELKLRTSYGVSGNENLGGGTAYYSYLPLFAFNANNTNPGYIFNTYGNPDLKWEGQYNFNVGLDFSLFTNRLSGTLDYYIRGSNDLLYVRPLAPSTGIGAVRENIGAMKNSGIELALHGTPVAATGGGKFTWTVDATLWHNRNQVTKVQSGQDTLFQGSSILAKGAPISNFFLPVSAGVDPKTGAEQWHYYAARNADGSYTSLGNDSTTTDYSLVDNNYNKRYAGTSFRDLEGSLTNTFRYKGFELSFLVTFGIGGKFYDGVYAGLMSPGYEGSGQALSTDILGRWQKEGDVTDVPAMSYASQGRLSDRFLISNSFLNIKNINLGYTFNNKALRNAGVNNLHVYVQLENVRTFTARKGMDVQQDFFGSSGFVYPPYRTLTFGVRLGL